MTTKLYIAMVGLPARGKSTVANRLCEGLLSSGIKAKIFNNGDLRRKYLGTSSTAPDFYDPQNTEGIKARRKIAEENIKAAKDFTKSQGQVAILDATNSSRQRRMLIEERLNDAPVLFIECVNTDPGLVEASVYTKSKQAEFKHLSEEEAIASFNKRILHYRNIIDPLGAEKAYLRLDSLNNSILEEKLPYPLTHYIIIRDILVSDSIKGLYLARHGETFLI